MVGRKTEMPKAGYCKECKKNVWIKGDGSCQLGHSASSITGVYEAETQGAEGVKSKRAEVEGILIVSSFDLPRKTEPLGLVTANVTKASNFSVDIVAKELAKKAREMGADAVVGFRFFVVLNSLNWTEQIAYGTAVKYVD